ncbi:MAG: SEC-C domain-containing protein [Opitutaceae bacterium]|jgi:hypothetical protein|nr:SEC-C domain-containing protein [Opitutaceae bacterium]
MPENAPAVLTIRHDLVWGYYANTTPGQTAVIKELFDVDDDDFFLNHPAAARLHIPGFDFIDFPSPHLPEIRKALARSEGKITPAPSVVEVAGTTWPPAVLSLLKLGVAGDGPLKTPPDYYQKLGITAADIPELTRLFQSEEMRLNENNDASHAFDARRHAQRALYELRAPGLARLLLEDYHDAGDDAGMYIIPEESIQIIVMLGAEAYAAVLAMLEEHPGESGFCDDILPLLADIVQKSAPEQREHCVGVLAGRLQNHAVNERDHNALLVGALCDIKAVEAAPIIEQAYAAGHVRVDFYGDWESVQISLGLKTKRDTPEWVEREAIRRERNPALNPFMNRGVFVPPGVRFANPDAPKIGRNAPCPCGSGKKYKKCCMGKKT